MISDKVVAQATKHNLGCTRLKGVQVGEGYNVYIYQNG